MSTEILNNILDDNYDIEKEDSIKAMIGDFYNKKRMSIIIFVWFYGVLMMALTVWSAISFYNTEIVKHMIMYAALFLLGIQQVSIIKIFAWQIIHRSSIKRDIKKIELLLTRIHSANQSRKE